MDYRGFDLSGRVALVTGGSRGLGRAMAEGLAEAGASVAITARREEWLTETAGDLEGAGHEVFSSTCDITEPSEVETFVRSLTDELSPPDILVNNAGISWAAPSEEMPRERWKQVLEVNLTGTFTVTQIVGRTMIQGGGGSIINISSVAGLRGMNPELLQTLGYNTTKGGIVAFTRDLAVKWAPHGIRVNALAPNFFPTRMSREVIEKNRSLIQDRTPMGRVGDVDEMKGPAVFLASGASRYVTGQVLAVDGGYSIA